MANPITFIEITSKNSKEMIDFYQNVFWWNVYPPAGEMEYRVMDPKSPNHMLAAIADPYSKDKEEWVAFYIGVESVNDTIDEVLKNGGSIVVPKFTTDTGFTQALVKDNKGHVLGIQEQQ